jgi:hypothetical protein
MKCTTLKFYDHDFGNEWKDSVVDRWDYRHFQENPDWKRNWISFDCLCYYPGNDTVYSGITSFAAEIFRGYSRKDKKFVSTGYERIADPFDAKFHRSLVEFDGCLYGAIALLHDIDRYWDAPGGAIIKYDPRTNRIEKLGIPLKHTYIQSIVIDREWGIIYGQTFTPERLFSFDINSRKTRDLGPIGSGMAMAQGENIILDDGGTVWGTWGLTRAWQSSPGVDQFRLWRYRPGADRIEFLSVGLPMPDKSRGFAKPEAFFNFGTGCLYASGPNGSLYRIETDSGRAHYLFTPIQDRRSRLASMALGPDGFAYGVTGRDGKCELLRFDPKREKYELLGPIRDGNGVNCWQVHDIIMLDDGTIYAGENDVPDRSGYLWEIKL